MYRIERITYKDDTERRDNTYSARKGCIGNISKIITGQLLWFDYEKDNQGNNKKGCLRTSVVVDFVEDGDLVIVETMNSVYYFKKIIND